MPYCDPINLPEFLSTIMVDIPSPILMIHALRYEFTFSVSQRKLGMY